MNLEQTLTQVFSTNFMAYLHSHIAHVNIVGRNFASDHKLLQKIYEDLQAQIDTLAENLRTIRAYMPNSIDVIMDNSQILNNPIEGSAEQLLMIVYEDIEVLIADYRELVRVADEEGAVEISNFAQDRLLVHQKQCWMLRATLADRMESYDMEDEDEELF
jgi:starvation-inducible DNA-binding protein